MNFKDYKEQNRFELWAFGKSPVTYDMSTMYAWNSRHGKDLWLEEDTSIVGGVEKMYAMFLIEHEKLADES